MSQHEALVNITSKQLADAKDRHKWLIDIIEQAGKSSLSIPFYQEVEKANDIEAFHWTRQLYHHSYTLTHFIAEVCSKEKSNEMRCYYAGHLYEEAAHADMLYDWMLRNGIVSVGEDLKKELPNMATSNCINFGSRLALIYNMEDWIVGINSGVEKCSQVLFSTLVPILKNLRRSDEYFEVHVEADEYHSTEGFVFLPTYDPDSQRGKYLRQLVLQGISLWCAMLNSWVDVHETPFFDDYGRIHSYSKMN